MASTDNPLERLAYGDEDEVFEVYVDSTHCDIAHIDVSDGSSWLIGQLSIKREDLRTLASLLAEVLFALDSEEDDE